MYLARNTINNTHHYVLRESYKVGEYYCNRDLFDLGANPANYIIYTGDASFHIDDRVIEGIKDKGVETDHFELEDFFFLFLDPYLQQRIMPFRNRQQYRSWQPMDEQAKKEIQSATHLFDRRRVHFLRFGPGADQHLDRSPTLYRKLMGKSRDEIEQLIRVQELELQPREYKPYLFSIFDLQRFFTESYARTMPQALNPERLDELFVQELCRLNDDVQFWQGFERSHRLPDYLLDYLLLYFDTSFEEELVGNAAYNSSRRSKRRNPPARKSANMSIDKAASILGISRKRLATMGRKELTKIYRKKALSTHPDKGGDTEQFVELTAAYEELLRTCQ